MRSVWSVVAVAILLSGCIASTTPKPITGPGQEWTEAESDNWMHQRSGCGFCSGNPDATEFGILAYHPTGEVLRVQYGAGRDAGQEGIQFTPGTEAMEAAVRDLFADLGREPENGTVFRIHTVVALRLPDGDATAVTNTFRSNLRHASDPGEPDFSDTADYGGTRITVIPDQDGDIAWDVNLNAEHHKNDAWGGILDQVRNIQQWIAEQDG